jgi:CDP-diacylglycerol---serine O-phosphatidyltransferase
MANSVHKNKRIKNYLLREKIYRKRFLVPNAVTMGSMFCGFLTIIYSATGRFDKASIAIGIAILLDGLDGRVARSLNATSRFGVEYDSFADCISFGIAPAALMYFWCFHPSHKADEFGVFVSFIYVVCAASRLARFNLESENLKSFTGLPSPAAAGAVASIVNLSPVINSVFIEVVLSTLTLLSIGYLMISNIPYLSIKSFRHVRVRTSTRILVAALIGLIWYNSGVGFFVLAFTYVLSGPVLYFKGASGKVRS